MTPGPIENDILQCLAAHYGFSGSLTRLSGENLNYLLMTPQGEKYVVKIVDDDMPPDVVEMEFKAIKYAISAGFSLQLPEIIKNKNKNIETGIKIHRNELKRLRVIHFIDGNILENVTDISEKLLKNVGFSVASFNLATQGFRHPCANRNHRWNLASAGQHLDKIELVDKREKRALLSWGFQRWRRTESLLKSLPWQFIHGDMNRENILVSGDRVTGLVDFGDCGFNPTVCDLAICLAYIMMNGEDFLQTAAIVTRGYEEIRPLSDAEHSVLLPLVCGRLATSIAVSNWRKQIDPTHPNWFDSEEDAWRLLEKLESLSSTPGSIEV